LKFSIPHCQDFIHHQNLGFQMSRHSKSQAQIHPAGIPLDRRFNELGNLGKFHNLIKFPVYFTAVHAKDGTV